MKRGIEPAEVLKLKEELVEFTGDPDGVGVFAQQGLARIGNYVNKVGIDEDLDMDASVMPWVIASQTIPILAIAPMIIVVLNSVGVTGLLPKALISMYLSFFPVAVGMVRGLRSPDRMLLDQMRTWNASRTQVFLRLRWPAKTGLAAALVRRGILHPPRDVDALVQGLLDKGVVAELGHEDEPHPFFDQKAAEEAVVARIQAMLECAI